jgi:hypothetical protein
MDRLLPSLMQTSSQELESVSRFRRALRRSDQVVLDDLFASIQKYQAAAANAVNTLPVENLLLAMLLEEHKEVARLRIKLEALQNGLKLPEESTDDI